MPTINTVSSTTPITDWHHHHNPATGIITKTARKDFALIHFTDPDTNKTVTLQFKQGEQLMMKILNDGRRLITYSEDALMDVLRLGFLE